MVYGPATTKFHTIYNCEEETKILKKYQTSYYWTTKFLTIGRYIIVEKKPKHSYTRSNTLHMHIFELNSTQRHRWSFLRLMACICRRRIAIRVRFAHSMSHSIPYVQNKMVCNVQWANRTRRAICFLCATAITQSPFLARN